MFFLLSRCLFALYILLRASDVLLEYSMIHGRNYIRQIIDALAALQKRLEANDAGGGHDEDELQIRKDQPM